MPDMGSIDLDGFSIGGSVGPGLDNRERDVVQVGNALEKTGGFTPYADGPTDHGVPADSLFAGSIMGFQAQAGHDPDGAILADGPTGRSLGAAMTARKAHSRDAALTKDNLPRGLLADGLLDGGRRDRLHGPKPKPAAIRNPVGAGQANAPADVRTVRSNLSRIGYGQRAVDVTQPNRFDRNLAAGMKRFQARKGLKVDGVANPGGPTERALHQQVGRQQAAVKQAYEKEAASLTRLLGAIGPALAGWRIGQRVAQDQNERRASVDLPPAPPLASKEDGTIMNAVRRVADGDAPLAMQKPLAMQEPSGASNMAAIGKAPATTAKDTPARTGASPGSPDRATVQLAQAKGPDQTAPARQKKDAATGGPPGTGDAGSVTRDRYTVRHDVNTTWTAKGTIWTPAADAGDKTASAPKIPAKREIYVGKFLHDKATEKLGLKEAADVDMAAASATVLGMAKAGKSKKAAMAWLVKNVVAKAPADRRKPLTTLLAKAVLNAWGGKDGTEKESGWYLITADHTPEMARKRLQGAYDKLIAVNKYMRGQLGRSLTADALEHWLNGSGHGWRFDPQYIRARSLVKRAEKKIRTHYSNWLNGSLIPKDKREHILKRLKDMPVGANFVVPVVWDGDINPSAGQMFQSWISEGRYHEQLDFIGATGASKLKGRSSRVSFRKVSGDRQNGTVMVSGLVNFTWRERFNFDEGKTTWIPSISRRPGIGEKPGKGPIQLPIQYIVAQDRMRELLKYSNARDFTMTSTWQYTLNATLQIRDGRIHRVRLRWLPVRTE